MKKTIFVLCLIATLIWQFSKPVLAEAPNKSFDDYSVQELIEYIAPQFKQESKLISKITWCESNHKIVEHDGGRGINITGIHDATFRRWLPDYEKETGETLDINSQFDQLKMMSWAFSKGEEYRDDWTTYVAYKKGGEYTFYSKLLKKTFTARCK